MMDDFDGFYSWHLVELNFSGDYRHIISILVDEKRPRDKWIKENCVGDHVARFHTQKCRLRYYFESGDDAMAFKMMWG